MDPVIQQLLSMYQASHQGQMYPGIRQGGMFGGGQSPMGQQPAPPVGQPMTPAQPADGQLPPVSPPEGQQDHHHGGLSGILPYLGFGLLGGSLLGGNMGTMAPLFGLGGMLAKKGGLFK